MTILKKERNYVYNVMLNLAKQNKQHLVQNTRPVQRDNSQYMWNNKTNFHDKRGEQKVI